MILSRFVAALCFAGLTFSGLSYGQTTALPAAPTSTPPHQDPKILEDGGFSIEAMFWLTQAQPKLYSGKTATTYGDLAFPGKSKKGLGVELGFPAGRANTLRFSYFRVQGSSSPTIGLATTVFGEPYAAGDYMVNSYKLQNAKVSWDYLSYTFKNRIRFKTLYELQYNTISSSYSAPLIPQAINASTGVADTNSSTGTKSMFLPTFGIEFQQPVNKRLRWEVRGSGFGIPHRAVIWDAQADIALRFSALEFQVGGKAYHFKTSPNSDQYFSDTLDGAYVAIRYYLSKPTN
jgi:hypothetical protein